MSKSEVCHVAVIASTDKIRHGFMGSLIYRCGLEMSVLEQLERNQQTQYEQIVPFMQTKGLDLVFHTPSNRCIFSKPISHECDTPWYPDGSTSYIHS